LHLKLGKSIANIVCCAKILDHVMLVLSINTEAADVIKSVVGDGSKTYALILFKYKCTEH